MYVPLSSVHRSMLVCVHTVQYVCVCVCNVNSVYMYMYSDWWQSQRLTGIHILPIPEIPRCDNCLIKYC